MCARFTLTLPDYAALARALGVEIAGAPLDLYHPRYNAAPGQQQLILRAHDGRREIIPARWGLIPRWAKDPRIASRLVNARAETAPEKPAFRDAFVKRRCVVPADGFYEWGGKKGDRHPFWFHPKGGGLLRMAGLYESWKDPETGEQVRTFTILTTPANEVVGKLHTRMPALLGEGELDVWLGAEAEAASIEALLRPAAADVLEARPVSTRVNTVTHDEPSLIDEVRPEEPAARARPGETLPLFKLN